MSENPRIIDANAEITSFDMPWNERSEFDRLFSLSSALENPTDYPFRTRIPLLAYPEYGRRVSRGMADAMELLPQVDADIAEFMEKLRGETDVYVLTGPYAMLSVESPARSFVFDGHLSNIFYILGIPFDEVNSEKVEGTRFFKPTIFQKTANILGKGVRMIVNTDGSFKEIGCIPPKSHQ